MRISKFPLIVPSFTIAVALLFLGTGATFSDAELALICQALAMLSLLTGGLVMFGLPSAEDWLRDALLPRQSEYDFKQVLTLGKCLDRYGELERVGIQVTNGVTAIDTSLINHHIAIVGEPGSGKTTLLLRIVEEICKNTDWDILFIDGKGEYGIAKDVQGVCYKHNRIAPIIEVGTGRPSYPYNMFVGDPVSIKNRLMAICGFDQLDGNAGVYKSFHELALTKICDHKSGPPQSLEELRERFDPDWLRKEYPGDWEAQQLLQDRGREPAYYVNTAAQFASLYRELSRVCQSHGYRLEDGSGIFSICVPNAPLTGKRFFNGLAYDVKSWMTTRKSIKKSVIIVDEFPAFDIAGAEGIASMARSHNLGFIITSQSFAALGAPNDRGILLGNMTTIISMRQQNAKDSSEHSGTHDEPHITLQTQGGEPTDMGSIRKEPVFNIHPSDIKTLGKGECFIDRHERWVKVKIDRVEDIPEVPPVEMPELKTNGTPTAPMLVTPTPPTSEPAKDNWKPREEL